MCAALITGSTDTVPNTPLIDPFRLPAASALDRTPFAWTVNRGLVVGDERAGTDYESCRRPRGSTG